jgi:hypothetical protein
VWRLFRRRGSFLSIDRSHRSIAPTPSQASVSLTSPPQKPRQRAQPLNLSSSDDSDSDEAPSPRPQSHTRPPMTTSASPTRSKPVREMATQAFLAPDDPAVIRPQKASAVYQRTMHVVQTSLFHVPEETAALNTASAPRRPASTHAARASFPFKHGLGYSES